MSRIGIVAGEASGDLLGGDLITDLKAGNPEIEFSGIGGEKMVNAGCKCIYPVEKLAVMGISEIFGRYFELLRIRSNIRNYFLANPPDLFIGIDAPDFNFPLEKELRKSGIKTVHYVSPSIWAWREYRLAKISKCIDLMMTLFPFEPAYYEKYAIPVRFVGHPLAQKISMVTDKQEKRQKLGLPGNRKIIAVLPGSRKGELEKLVTPFLQAINICHDRIDNLLVVFNLVNEEHKKQVELQARQISPGININFYSGQSLDVMGAADVVLLASGTAALEAMLLKRPMVVAYKVNWITYQLVKRLIRLPYVSLPNVLAGRKLVPECLQQDCQAENLGREIIKLFNEPERTKELENEFRHLHECIIPTPENSAASVIRSLLSERN